MGGRFLGYSDDAIWLSRDGQTWSRTYENAGRPITSAAYGQGRWLVLRENDSALRSEDEGQTWATLAAVPPAANEIIFANGIFLVTKTYRFGKYTVGDLAGCYDSEGRYGGTDLCAQKICKGYWPGDLAEPFHQGGLPAWISVDRGSTWKVARDPVEGIPYMLRALGERLVIFSSHILKLYGVQPATCTVPSEFTPFHFSLETTDGASWTTRCPHRGGSGFAGVPNCIEREWALPGRFLDVYELGRVRITSNWNGCANALIGARNDPTRDPDYVPINSSSALPPYLPRHHGDQVAVGAGGLVGLFRPCNDETTAPGRIQFYGYPVGSEMPPDSWPHEPWQIQDPIEYPGTSVTFGRAEIAPANTPAGDGYQPLVP